MTAPWIADLKELICKIQIPSTIDKNLSSLWQDRTVMIQKRNGLFYDNWFHFNVEILFWRFFINKYEHFDPEILDPYITTNADFLLELKLLHPEIIEFSGSIGSNDLRGVKSPFFMENGKLTKLVLGGDFGTLMINGLIDNKSDHVFEDVIDLEFETLDIEYNSNYYQSLLKYFPNVEKLKFNHCLRHVGDISGKSVKYARFPDRFFAPLKHLKDLNLRGNHLEFLPEEFNDGSITTLEHLVLLNCSIKSLDPGLFLNNPDMISLELSNNPIDGLPHEILNCKKLFSINFSETEINADLQQMISRYYNYPKKEMTRSELNSDEMKRHFALVLHTILQHYFDGHSMKIQYEMDWTFEKFLKSKNIDVIE